jgi:signal transduction histidine kinase
VEGVLGQDLGRMEREALRCREIVESLLKLAKPAVAPAAAPVDLREVAQDVAGALGVAMNGSAPAIAVVGEATALAAQPLVRQIVLNLAKNAAEAAGPHGAVEIRLGREAARALVTVSDTGPGIPPGDRARVFDPFFTTKRKGTGLGLPIARSMAGALGGDLELESGEAGGARFTLRLPPASPGGEP